MSVQPDQAIESTLDSLVDSPSEVTSDRRELIARHLAGDTQAFPELVGHYKALVYTYLIRAGLSAASADDLFQEIFLLVHRNCHRFLPTHSLKPWLLTITVNTVRSHFRKERARPAIGGELQEGEIVDGHTPATAHEAKETAEWLEAELGNLPLEQREVMVLHCIRGLEQRDVAEILDIPINTVKTLVRRARIALAQKLAQRSSDEREGARE